MTTIRSSLMLAAFALFSATARTADLCDLELQMSSVNLVWSLNLPTQTLPFKVLKKKSNSCTYWVTFSKGGATTYDRRMLNASGEALRYQLYKDLVLSNVLKEYPEASSSNDVVYGNFPSGKNIEQTQNFYLSIPNELATSPTLVPRGTYRNSIVVKAYSSLFFFPLLEDQRTFDIQTVVPAIVDISLVASGGAFNENDTSEPLNFGTLVKDDSKGFDLRVRSNAGYRIAISSQNGGQLKHAQSSVTTTVPYTLYVSGQSRALSAGTSVEFATGSGETALTGVALPVSVKIGDVADKVAGNYSDFLTITATSNE